MQVPVRRGFCGWRLLRRFLADAEDRVAVRLPGLEIAVDRSSRDPVPAELTVVVPRAELRARLTTPDGAQASVEVLLNSITVVHSPRHAPGRESGPAGS